MYARIVLLVVLIISASAIANDLDSADKAPGRLDGAVALKLLKELAEFGDPTAQFDLAVGYEFGTLVPQDYEQAAYWYRKSAEQGLAIAQSHLGVLYTSGKGVARDYDQAAFWYGKAAEQGDQKAQNNLGAMYFQGQGVPRDVVQAYFWWLLAVVQGNRSARRNLDMAQAAMMPDEISEAYGRASEWWRR